MNVFIHTLLVFSLFVHVVLHVAKIKSLTSANLSPIINTSKPILGLIFTTFKLTIPCLM
ncbi:hypothetical protein ACB098_07G089500 [Castanea mollissima]